MKYLIPSILIFAYTMSAPLYGSCAPSLNIDYTSSMPPVYNQGSNPWCYAYSSKSVLESFHYRQTGRLENFAIVDMVGKIKPKVKDKQLGLVKKVSDGGDPIDLFDAATTYGGFLHATDMPEDSLLFSQKRDLLAKLRAYYEKPTSSRDCSTCLDPLSLELGISYRTIDSLKHATRQLNNFLVTSTKTAPLDDLFLPPTDKSVVTISPFKTIIFKTKQLNTFIQELQNALISRGPTTISLCGTLLNNRIRGESASTDCGAHAVVISGLRERGGQCEYLVRNSWGAAWPFKKGDKRNAPGGGEQWISQEILSESMSSYPDFYTLISVEKREESDSVRSIMTSDGIDIIHAKTINAKVDGEFIQYNTLGEIVGKGVYKNGTVYDGYELINGVVFKYKKGVIDMASVRKQLAARRKKK